MIIDIIISNYRHQQNASFKEDNLVCNLCCNYGQFVQQLLTTTPTLSTGCTDSQNNTPM